MESVLAWREFYVPVCLDMNILRLMDFKCVSYESICGIGYRVFAASGKYFMGKGKSVCDYCNPFPYCFKSNSAIIIALPDLFYRRGIFCCLCDEYGDSWNCFFSGIVAATWNFVSCSACAFTAGRTAQVL